VRLPTFSMVLVTAVSSLGCGAATPEPSVVEIATVPMSGSPVALTEIRVNPAPQTPLTWNSGFTAPQRIVVRTQQEWASTWATIWSRQTPVPALPAVDFTREVVVVAASGVQSNGGVQIEIPNAALDQGTVKVGTVETFPGANCVTAAVNSSPVFAARMVRFDGPISFTDVRSTKDCP
jgi:hypothetical protein